jgi:hypothetical protein
MEGSELEAPSSGETSDDEEASPASSEQEEDSFLPAELRQLHIYGYFSVRFEKVFSEPSRVDGVTVREDGPAEWSLPFFHLMLQHRLSESFKIFVNLNGGGGGTVDVRNMWGEYSVSDPLNIRMGKIYRKFGLYNEILDAVPTYIGIEPPELFDGDHLILSRTTNLMAHGRFMFGTGNLNYSVTNDNGEGDPVKGTIPIGFDLNYKFRGDDFTIGTSGYTSNGPTRSDVVVGQGPPNGGVLPWMAEDEFNVFGAYFEGKIGSLTLQTEYWQSPHDALRDPAQVVVVVENADLNARQRVRFLEDPNGPVTEDNVNTVADYEVKTWYLRSGYSIETEGGEFVPYFQWDWYSNPETIADKQYGGDNEAGVADDGKFSKATVGLVYRPIPEVAVKIDASSHLFRFNGEDVGYPEIRFDISYVFGQ